MASQGKKYDDDDGRTIADMSGVEKPRLILPRHWDIRKPRAVPPEPGQEKADSRPWEEQGMSREERRIYALAALWAALLIALVFIVGLVLVIALLLWIWG